MTLTTSVRSVNHWSLNGSVLRQSCPRGKYASCSPLPTIVILFLWGELVANVRGKSHAAHHPSVTEK